MRVAIIGSRSYPDLAAVREYVRGLPAGASVISGGAWGVDDVAVTEARLRGLIVDVHLPRWDLHGKRAGAIRNQRIVDACDRIVAFWDGISKGTKIAIDMAKRAGKPCEIITPAVVRGKLWKETT